MVVGRIKGVYLEDNVRSFCRAKKNFGENLSLSKAREFCGSASVHSKSCHSNPRLNDGAVGRAMRASRDYLFRREFIFHSKWAAILKNKEKDVECESDFYRNFIKFP